jgi:cyanophycinase
MNTLDTLCNARPYFHKIYFLFWLPFILFHNGGCQDKPTESIVPNTNQTYSIGLLGDKNDVTTATSFGIVLMGGSTDVDEAMEWMIEKSGGGDFLILRSSGSVGYNSYLYNLGELNSVETLLIDSKSKAQSEAVGKRIREAEAVFIAGGDQANYINFWSDTEVSRALQYLISEKKIPIGGTSAGCAVLSHWIYDAKNGSVVSDEALANPFNSKISFTNNFLSIPFLGNTLADQHYAQRNRQGRQAAFLARLKKENPEKDFYGIGVDEKTAVCIDENGLAKVLGTNKSYFIKTLSTPEVCLPNQPLQWFTNQQALSVNVLNGTVEGINTFSLVNWTISADEYWYVENGVLKINN